ncbi:MAG: DUF3810 domain-containing protein [Chitinophagaceae bacterium]|nr:DUF3810 domain-containing protein [Chitinophagaceae bacterium]
MLKRKHFGFLSLAILAILIKIFSLFPEAVERYYSDGFYPIISQTQRILIGWIPFSMGDILYFATALYLLLKTIAFIKRMIRKEINRSYLLHVGKKILTAALVVYILFNVLWGLNYNRVGIAKQLELTRQEVLSDDLMNVMQQIVYRINALDSLARINRLPLTRKRNLFEGSVFSYQTLAEKNSLFTYSRVSVKPSLYSYLGNYMGFTGYYNPFSGEAQVNTTVPVFIQPFTTCHEIGHQLGYAKESEANFAGYLSASSSTNPAFRYSAYFDLYLYGRRYVYLLDTIKGKQLDNQLNPGIRKDIRDLREFVNRHANPIEKIIDLLYSQFLKANEQPSGRVSYSEVIVWVIAYYKKYGRL